MDSRVSDQFVIGRAPANTEWQNLQSLIQICLDPTLSSYLVTSTFKWERYSALTGPPRGEHTLRNVKLHDLLWNT